MDETYNANPTKEMAMNRIGAYTRQQHGDATIFQVVPADVPKFWPLDRFGLKV